MYYSDWGSKPKVVRARLDGTGAATLLDTQVSNPNGIALRNGQVYIVDSNYDKKMAAAQILIYKPEVAMLQSLRSRGNLSVSTYIYSEIIINITL
jgi:hypothetical protein